MTTDETPPSPLETRLNAIQQATRDLMLKVVALIGEGSKPSETQKAADILAPALTLIEVAIVGITEIADAQTRLANLAEYDLAETMRLRKEEREALEQAERDKLNKPRNFLGQKT